MIERYVSPLELKRLLSALLVVTLFIALLAVFGFLVLPGLRNANEPSVEVSVNQAGVTGWLDPTDFPSAPSRTEPPVDPKTVMTPTSQMLSLGQATFGRNCSSCHGPSGEGNGPAGQGLNPRPRNFTQKDGWVVGTRMENIYKTLEEGIKGSSMVSYISLSKRERMALVHYVQSLGKFDHGPEDPKALKELSEQFARSGEVIPNRIPVALAMIKLETEFTPPGALPAAAGSGLGAAITDPFRAALTLAGVPGWAGNDQALAQGIVFDAPANGFAPAVALYSGDQWQALRGALTRPVKEIAR